MALLVHLPLTGDLNNQGLADVEVTNNGATVDNNGKMGKCYSFDGSDDYISLDSSALYSAIKGGSIPFSVAMWIYCADSTRGVLFGDYGLTGAISFNVELTASQQLRFYWGGNDIIASSAIAPLNAWIHVVFVYDGTKVDFYVDGVLSHSRTATLAIKNKTTGSYYLGRDSRTGTTAFSGKMNDLRVYDHALSPMEVKHLSQGLVLHYPLDGNNGTLVNENLLHGSNVIGSGTTIYGWVSNGSATGMEILSDGSLHYKYNISNSKNIPSITTNTVVPCEFSKTYFYSMDLKFDKAITLGLSTPAHFWVGARNSNSITNTSCSGNLTGIQTEYISNHSGTLPANTWVHITTKFTFPTAATSSGYNYPAIRCFVYGSVLTETTTGEVNVWMKNCKVEEGSIPTPWCPNPSDALYTALGYDDGIEYDTSGYGNNGTKVGTFDYSTDSPRYLASTVFDDVSKYIKDVYAIKGLTMNEISVSFWFNTSSSSESISGDGGNFFSFGYNNGLRVRIPKSSTNKIWIYGGFGAITLTSNTSFVDGKWHFFIITFNNGVFKCFLDGIQIDSDVTKSISAITFADNEFYVIATSRNGTEYFVGNLSDFRIYASCLSPLDVEALYKTSGAIDSNGNSYAYEYIEN